MSCNPTAEHSLTKRKIPDDPEAFARRYGVRLCDVVIYEKRNGVERVAAKYEQQREHAKKRGIEWLFDLNGWMAVWDGKIAKRGRGLRALCMCRHKDEGPYAPGNVRIATGYENKLDWWEKKPRWSKRYGSLPHVDGLKTPVGVDQDNWTRALCEVSTGYGTAKKLWNESMK